MIAEPKFKAHQDDNDGDKRERRHQEEALDEALKTPFRRPIPFQSRRRPPAVATGQRPEG